MARVPDNTAMLELQRAFLALRHADGIAAGRFISALRVVSETRMAEYLASPPEEILRLQGRAQEATRLADRLASAREDIENMENMEKGN